MKKKSEQKSKKISKILRFILLGLLILIMLLVVLNSILRKPLQISEENYKALKTIFPEEHINKIKIYQGGLISVGSTRTLCNAIYFPSYSSFAQNQSSKESIRLLVHEAVHTYQSESSCARTLFSSLYSQLRAGIKYNNRNYAYYYPLDLECNLYNSEGGGYLNAEQEATIIEDYFYIKYQNGSKSGIFCYDCNGTNYFSCGNYSKDFLIDKLGNLTSEILGKYKK